jgi:peroxiredoxin Q/BCP
MAKKLAKKPASRAVSRRSAKPVDGGGPLTGAKAPAFRLPRDGGGTIGLADFAGRKLVLYFYPRADTSGCTREAIDFSRLKAAFSRAGTEILGISADPVAALDRFKAKHKLAIVLGI